MSLLPGKQVKRKNPNPSLFQTTVSTEPSSCTEKIKALFQLLKVYIMAHMAQPSDISGSVPLVLGLVGFFIVLGFRLFFVLFF